MTNRINRNNNVIKLGHNTHTQTLTNEFCQITAHLCTFYFV